MTSLNACVPLNVSTARDITSEIFAALSIRIDSLLRRGEATLRGTSFFNWKVLVARTPLLSNSGRDTATDDNVPLIDYYVFATKTLRPSSHLSAIGVEGSFYCFIIHLLLIIYWCDVCFIAAPGSLGSRS